MLELVKLSILAIHLTAVLFGIIAPPAPRPVDPILESPPPAAAEPEPAQEAGQ